MPSSQDYPQTPDINNLGHAAWSDFDFIELWNGEETVVFTEGHIPALNDRGDMAFQRASPTSWQVWVYLNGQYFRLSDTEPPLQSGRADINNDGEVVWRWVHSTELSPGGIRFLRRVRNGDIDFNSYVDSSDFSSAPDCLTGPGDFDHLCACRFLDMQHDRDVDLSDFGLYQNAVGPGQDCCTNEHGPGCNDHAVQNCVCADFPACCTTEWDSGCVLLVELLGCGQCN